MNPRSVHSDEYRLLAALLRETRLKHKITQEELASRLGRPRSFTHKVENADREINVIELMDYCSALGEDFLQFTVKLAVEVNKLRLQKESKSL